MFNSDKLELAIHFHNLVTEQYDCIIKIDEYKRTKNNLIHTIENIMDRCVYEMFDTFGSNLIISEVEIPFNKRDDIMQIIKLYAQKYKDIKIKYDEIVSENIDIYSYYIQDFDTKFKIFDNLSKILVMIRVAINSPSCDLLLEMNTVNKNMINVNFIKGSISKLELKNDYLEKKIEEIKRMKEECEE